MSTLPFGAVAATRPAATKTSVPVRNSRRRPRTSPVWPRVMSSEAGTSE